MGITPKKVGGYLILSGIFGGFFGAMAWDIGLYQATVITGVAFAVISMMQLAIYLIWEAK